MDKSGASAYVYAKASGMLARSFIGERSLQLFEAKSLTDLWTLVFNSEVPLVPEVLLARQLEQKAEDQFVADFKMLMGCYSKPEPVALALLRSYDYGNLKDIAHALGDNRTELPRIIDIGEYSQLHFDAWPSIQEITADSPFSWYNKVPDRSEQHAVDRRLDIQYTMNLWQAVGKVPAQERGPVKNLIKRDIVLTNCLWALRLRVYYNMTDEEIVPQLVALSEHPDETDELAGEAVKMLQFRLDTYDDWKKWTFAEFVNPPDPSGFWSVDPRWVGRAARASMQRYALKKFHQYPFTAFILVAWFKIKQHELDCIRTAAEGLRLSVGEEQLKEFAGIKG